MTNVATASRAKKYGRLVAYSVAFIVIVFVVGIILYYALYVYNIIPPSFKADQLVEVLVAFGLGLLVITLLGKEISAVSSRLFGAKHASMIYVVFRFVSYIVLALVVIYIAIPNPTALLAGGTFAGLVLGLASQTVLSNIMGGIMVILARPYEVGDRITFTSWQYGLIVPAYPPKFFSHDTLIPGYSGVVLDIGLAYSRIHLDEGPSMKIPNSIMVQAAIVSHELQERWVRTKYEIPVALEPDMVLPALSEVIRKNQWVTKPDTVNVLINSSTATSYIVSIDAQCKGNLEEGPRSSILIDMMRTINQLKLQRENEEKRVNT